MKISVVLALSLSALGICSPTQAEERAAGNASATHCEQMAQDMSGHWPDQSTQVMSSKWVAAGPITVMNLGGPPAVVPGPDHCELIAQMQTRTGANDQHYAIKFHLRMPAHWNGRFYFQGGGGSNGVLGDALGRYTASAAPALVQGFAVVSQDSGHDNQLNNDPARGGEITFGFDPIARANYGHASLPLVSEAAKAAIRQFYGAPAGHSYFVGCSKGGQEALVAAERYGGEFDGIAAGDPGMSLPRAAVAEAWNTQTFAGLAKSQPDGSVSIEQLQTALSNDDFNKVREAVLSACDAADGLKDGIVGDFAHCTTAKVLPALQAVKCSAAQSGDCLSGAKIDALVRVMKGAVNSHGEVLYSDFPWDASIASVGWRIWNLGSAMPPIPVLNVILGGPALATVFTTPPTAIGASPPAALQFLLHFDFDKDAPRIYATDAQFPGSGWSDLSARSADLGTFRAHRGKLIVFHGTADPIFSINDTAAWWNEVDHANSSHAASFVRLFPVPGMNHCLGGDATDQFDVLAPLVDWVEHGKAPEQILATADPMSPWPKRTRPLCPYPQIARYRGSGDVDSAASFECRR
jgi:hypothetical protein